jgi:hypothetical protein
VIVYATFMIMKMTLFCKSVLHQWKKMYMLSFRFLLFPEVPQFGIVVGNKNKVLFSVWDTLPLYINCATWTVTRRLCQLLLLSREINIRWRAYSSEYQGLLFASVLNWTRLIQVQKCLWSHGDLDWCADQSLGGKEQENWFSNFNILPWNTFNSMQNKKWAILYLGTACFSTERHLLIPAIITYTLVHISIRIRKQQHSSNNYEFTFPLS